VTTLIRSLAVVAAAAVMVGGLFYYNINYSVPAIGPNPVDVRVEQGDSLASVARKLREQNVVTNAWFFSLWARWRGAEKRIHQGLYRFDKGVVPREVLDRLVSGKGVYYSVTIPEGFTVREIANLLEKLEIADRDTFLSEASNANLLGSLGLNGKGLEGYLFPSTYHFTPGTSEKEIILTMAEQFRKVSLPLLMHRPPNMRLTTHEILTLASIIEKETGVPEERPWVSAVFHNRLKQQMPLQSDPTVIYGVKNFNGNLTRKDLQEETNPYNTYRIAALPPGPICNPSVASIKAALEPASVPYLYFVSKNDGTHLFSENIEAHNRAVKTYQPVRPTINNSRKLSARQ
jgi:UPF0755 protein